MNDAEDNAPKSPPARLLDYKNYLLVVLTAILTFNYVDRVALAVVMQDIKVQLHVTDTQLGFLSGIAFALFYSVMGVPIARWADRGNRITIISMTTLLWSLGVGACGMAANFMQLLLVRIGVAVGEAGCIPPAFSLIADYFSRAERPRAVAIYGMGGGIALVIGYLLAGWLNELYGWRVTFLVLSTPGPILAALAWFSLKEPRRSRLKHSNDLRPTLSVAPLVPQPSMREVFATLWTSATFRHLLLCLVVCSCFNYGMLQWQPAFFMRSFGLASGRVGTWLAVTYGVSTIAGTYLGGELATRYAPNDERLQLRGMSLAVAISGFLSVFMYLSTKSGMAFLWLGMANVGLSTLNGPLFSTIQTLVPERMRAVAFALLYLFSNLIGMGFGPLAAGALSDSFHPWAGGESLRYASLVLSPGYLWAAWHSWQASKTASADLAGVRVEV